MSILELTPAEMHTVAMACRIACRQAEYDAQAQENPRLRQGFEATAASYRELAERFEKARVKR